MTSTNNQEAQVLSDEESGRALRKLSLNTSVQLTGCIYWTGNTGHHGYGRIFLGRRTAQAHRVAWMLMKSPIPGGMLVCHHCDNRLCVNVAHLFLGSPMDNMVDRDRKGRAAAGTRNGLSRLTPEDVVAIRRGGPNCRTTAAKFNVSMSVIHGIRQNRTYLKEGAPLLPTPPAAGCS